MKKINFEKKESAQLPLDSENPIIIVPANCEISLIATNITPTFEELARREEQRKKREEMQKNPVKLGNF